MLLTPMILILNSLLDDAGEVNSGVGTMLGSGYEKGRVSSLA